MIKKYDIKNSMDNFKVIVLGDGFLGNTFKRHGYDVWGRDKFNWIYPNSDGSSYLKSYVEKYELIEETQLVVINTIGISDTRYCEDINNWDNLFNVNSNLPKYLSHLSKIHNFKFVHISTGCLYDKKYNLTENSLCKEDDFMAAHCNYVVSKWVGETGCDKTRDLIIRPRLLFDSEIPNKGRNNLICKLKTFDEFLYEYNSITSNDTIVESIEALLKNDQCGVFNVANTSIYTIVDIAKKLNIEVNSNNIIYEEDLHKSQGLYLVNNAMDLSKLMKYYTPRNTLDEIDRCNKILINNGG